MQIDWWTLALQAVNALVLLWLLTHFFFRPVADIMKKRQEMTGRALAEADKAKADASLAAERASTEAARLEADRAQILKAAHAEAETAKAALLEEARAEAAAIRKDAMTSADQAKKQQEREAARRSGRLATELASRLLGRLPADVLVSPFIDGLAAGLSELPPETRAELGGKDRPIRLLGPRSLTPDEQQACRAAVEAALGHDVSLEFSSDPQLIAGLELNAAHAAVRNSFRADLEALERELDRDGRE